MDSLYELTRKLVARGCPEHPRVRYNGGPYGERGWFLTNTTCHVNTDPHHEDDARAIWTCWALEWALSLAAEKKIEWDRYLELRGGQFRMCMFLTYYGPTRDGEWPHKRIAGGVSDILEAIESATRHLEPK